MINPRNSPRFRSRGDDWFMQVPLLTMLLCAACTVVSLGSFAAQWSHGAILPRFDGLGAEDQEQIWGGHLWSLFTTVFLHANVLHLLFNMIWLYQLGGMVERTLNTLAYVLFLVAATVVSSCAELFFGSSGIGASGVVYALFGLMWAGRGRHPEWGAYAHDRNLRLFIGWGIFCFVATQLHIMPIGNAAHAGGFLFGISVGWLFLSARPYRGLWALPLVGLLAMSALSVTWMPWSAYWTFWKAGREYDRQNYSQAIAWYQRSLRHGNDPNAGWQNIALAWTALGEAAAQRHDTAAAAHASQEAQTAYKNAGPNTSDNSQ